MALFPFPLIVGGVGAANNVVVVMMRYFFFNFGCFFLQWCNDDGTTTVTPVVQFV